MNKRFLILLLILFSIQKIDCQTIFDSTLNAFLSDQKINSATVSIELVNGLSGEVLIENNSNKLLLPASIQKLYTTSYALKELGGDYRFKTTVATNGQIDKANQLINGDLIISFSGDPSLESRYFDSLSFLNDLKYTLKYLNIKNILGRLIIIPKHDDYQVNSEWLWGDIGNYYGSGYSSHTFRDNYVEIYFNSTDSVGDITTIKNFSPEIDSFQIKNRVVGSSINRDFSYAYGAPYQTERLMIGHIPIKKNNYKVKISMHDPKVFLESSIIELLVSSGISISNQTIEKSIPLDTLMIYESPSLRDLVKCVNFKSNNNYAEHLLMKSVQIEDSSVMLSNAPVIMQDFWQSKINISNQVLFADGCGLSRKNLTSSHAINQLLLYQLKNKSLIVKDDFLNSLPEAGISGTLKYIGKGTLLEGNFIGKSGSMRSVRSYSGYFKKYNQYYPFTIMVNNFVCKDADVRKLIENLMISFYRKI